MGVANFMSGGVRSCFDNHFHFIIFSVIQKDRFVCRNAANVQVTSPSGYLASTTTAETQVGSSLCPWHIRAQPGQRISLQLLDFALWTDSPTDRSAKTPRNPPETSGICHIYASIRESTSVGSITVCGGDERIRTIYTSETEAIEIEMANMQLARTPSYFVLKYQGKKSKVYDVSFLVIFFADLLV